MEASENMLLETSAHFKVPVSELYRAWIDPESLKQWWQPSDLVLEGVENDVRKDGRISYVFKTKEGGELRVTGAYVEALAKKRLVYSWNWEMPEGKQEDGDFTLSIDFVESGQGSILQVRQEKFSKQDGLTIHQEAWSKAFKDLENYFTKNYHSVPDPDMREGSAPAAP